MIARLPTLGLMLVIISSIAQGTAAQNSELSSSQDSDLCDPNPCGVNTDCYVINGAYKCRCKKNYLGNPATYCTLPVDEDSCSDDSDCADVEKCINDKCVHVCVKKCGTNANCTSKNRKAICFCPKGYTGNPSKSCQKTTTPMPSPVPYLEGGSSHDSDPCDPNPCGVNTDCHVINGAYKCRCKKNYLGNPSTYCTLPVDEDSCSANNDCSDVENCISNKCVHVCVKKCGTNADCTAENRKAICSCPKGHIGNPSKSCQKMTTRPSRPPTPKDICNPNPCGENTQCRIRNDGTGNTIAVCSCLPGYLGDPLVLCDRGECTVDNDCGQDQACYGYKCKDVCSGQCGVDAMCEARDRVATCFCPKRMTGDPLVRCRPLKSSDLCDPNPCGENAQCRPENDNEGGMTAVCSCPWGYSGNPLEQCERGE